MSESIISAKDREELVDRFIRYCRIDTQSKDDTGKIPSTEKQFNLAKLLISELKAIGIDAELSDKCYVYATVPENSPTKFSIGLVSHMDVSPDSSAENIQPQVHKNISGEDITLQGGTVIVKKDLEFYKGQDIITSDGNTLLGADDKAGVSAIMQLLTIVQREPNLKHGKLQICFTPDEEIGAGVDGLDLDKFKPNYAFTVDGGRVGEIEDESFNAKEAVIKIKGHEVHPGYGFGVLINAQRVMGSILAQLPRNTAPETTKDRQGYIHPTDSQGDCAKASIKLILRDFEEGGLDAHVQTVRDIVAKVGAEFPGAQIDLQIKDQYRNMYTILKDHPFLVETVEKCIKAVGVTPIHHPIRGGTDGCRLTFMGIPTPNIFAGGENFHSRTEFLSIQSLNKVLETLVTLLPEFVN